VAFRFNSYIALALSERLAGAQGLQLIAVLIGVCVPLFNVAAIWPMARHAQTGLLPALVRNPLIIATGLGLAANLGGLAVPGWLEPTVARIGGSSIPLGLMAAGAGMRLGSLARSQGADRLAAGDPPRVTPLVAWALVRLLRLDPAQASVLLIFSACRLRQLLRAGVAHGLRRRLRRRAGDAIHPARRGEPHVRARRPALAPSPACSRTSALGWSSSARKRRQVGIGLPRRNALPAATATLRSQRSWPMRRMALPSVRRRNSASSQRNSAASGAPARPGRSSKSGSGLRWAYLFQGQASWQSSQP
jgi:hypothetical protein